MVTSLWPRILAHSVAGTTAQPEIHSDYYDFNVFLPRDAMCNWQKGRVTPQFNSQSPGGDMDRSARLSHSLPGVTTSGSSRQIDY